MEDAEAHNDDKGRKITTKVRTLELMAGRFVKYCKTENMARLYVSGGVVPIEIDALTWNDKSLASHDEYDLHWSKLTKAKLPSLIQCIAEFDNEDSTDRADTNGENDVRGAADPMKRELAFRLKDGLGIQNAESQTEADCQ